MSTLNPFEKKPTVNSENQDIVNAVTTSSIEDTAKGKNPNATGGVELDTDKIIRTDQLDEIAFMNDDLEVLFAEPATEHEPQFVEVNVNGDYRLAVRGDTTTLKRYHVAVIAQAKQSRVRQKKIVNADGSIGFQEENVLALSYPFQVVHDPRPKLGQPWLKQLMRNPG